MLVHWLSSIPRLSRDVFAVVQVDKKVGDKTYYKVAVLYKDAMHEFGPKLPSFVFEKGPEFRDFFITKCT